MLPEQGPLSAELFPRSCFRGAVSAELFTAELFTAELFTAELFSAELFIEK